MLEAVLSLPGQCAEGYRVGRAVSGLPAGTSLTAVAACGMGGSGVVGDIVRALYRERLGIPIEVVKGPVLPGFCGKDTLVVCSSYSGETAETLACFEEARGRGCRLVAVTSGGTLAALAREAGVAAVPVPPGFQPRAAVGFLACGVLGALEAMGVVPSLEEEVEESAAVLARLADALGPDVPLAENRAKALAARIGDRAPVVWGAEGLGSAAAIRWKTQMNENTKVPAFWSSLPELDHNEVVGWSGGRAEGFFLVALRHAGEPRDVAARFPVSLAVAEQAGLPWVEVWAEGRSPLARIMSLSMTGDLTSVYLALLRGVDPTPVEPIDRLKRVLAEGR